MNKIGLGDEQPTQVYLIRHGEVELPRQQRYNGHSDVALSPVGLHQLEALAERLAPEPIRAVYSSDLIRSRTGAEAIARRFGLAVDSRFDLREKNFGRWEGLTAHEVSERFPDEWRLWVTHPADCRPQGGESYRDAYGRVSGELGRILSRHPSQKIVVVGHGGVNRLILAYALKLDLACIHRIEQQYAALNIIDFYETSAVAKLVNG